MDYILSKNFAVNRAVSNIYGYATGVEVGLDSNGRKNRGGHQMENLIRKFLEEAGVEFYTEKYLEELEKFFGLDLSALSTEKISTKRFDFVVKSSDTVFGIETNFYASSAPSSSKPRGVIKSLPRRRKIFRVSNSFG